MSLINKYGLMFFIAGIIGVYVHLSSTFTQTFPYYICEFIGVVLFTLEIKKDK